MGICYHGKGKSGGAFKIDGGTMQEARVPILARVIARRGADKTEYREQDGWAMDVDGHTVYLHKNEYGNGYSLSAYGLLGKSYQSKREAVENAAKDAQDIVRRLGDAEMLQAQLNAVREAGGPVSAQKLAAIRRKIQQSK